MKVSYDVRRLYYLWTTGAYGEDICKELNIPRGSLYRHVRYHKLPARKQPPARFTGKPAARAIRLDTAGNGFEPRVDPTPEEIEERARWIRENWWTQERRDGEKPGVSEIPCYSWSPSRKRYSTIT
jgi:hypothetical protein